MKSNEQIIRDACIAANKDIMELKFGCRGIWHKPENENTKAKDMLAIVLTYHSKIQIINLMTDDPILYDNITGHVASILPSDFTILGRPIRLVDVLWMLNKNIEGKTDFYYEIDTAGNFIKRKRSFDEHGVVSSFPRWNLLQDDLSLQTEETKAFLAELLK